MTNGGDPPPAGLAAEGVGVALGLAVPPCCANRAANAEPDADTTPAGLPAARPARELVEPEPAVWLPLGTRLGLNRAAADVIAEPQGPGVAANPSKLRAS